MKFFKIKFKKELVIVSISQLLEAFLKLLIIIQVFVLGSSGWKMGYSKLTDFYLDNNGTTEGLSRITEVFWMKINEFGNVFVACFILYFFFYLMMKRSFGIETNLYKVVKNIWNYFFSLLKRIGLLGILIEFNFSSNSNETLANGFEAIFTSIIAYVLIVRINQLNTNLLVKEIFTHAEVQHECIRYAEGQWDYALEQNYFLIKEEWIPYFKEQVIIKNVTEELENEKKIYSYTECASKFKWLFGGFKFSLTETQMITLPARVEYINGKMKEVKR